MSQRSATLTLVVRPAAAGREYFVAPAGSDANPGTAAAPFLTLQKGASVLKPGDTLTVRAGAYAGFVVGWDAAGLYGPVAGTAAAPIIVRADPAAPPGSVVVNSRNHYARVGIDLEPGSDWIVIDGFTVDGAGGTITLYPDKGSGIKVTGKNCTVQNCTVRNILYGQGIVTNYADNVRILNNDVSRAGSNGGSNQGHGIYVAGGCTGARVAGNFVHDNEWIGLHVNGDPDNVANALVENNVFARNGQNSINCDGLVDSVVRNNLVYGFARCGIALYRIDAALPSTGNVVENNTVVSAVDGAASAVLIKNGSAGNVLRNNVLLGGNGISLRTSADSLPGLVSDYNVVTPTPYQSDDTAKISTLAQWQAAGRDAHSVVATAAQLFADPANNDYHLKAGSPAVDAGAATGAPPTDLDGVARPQGAGVDVGCYERPA